MKILFKRVLPVFLIVLTAFACKSQGKSKNIVLDYQYIPAEREEKDVAILILGGSDGGIPHHYHNPEITKGCPVMKLGYFGTDNTPSNLEEIPLEYFDRAIDEFKTKDSVADKKLIVIGTSKGGELALLLASLNPKIEGVVAIVPASVSFQSIGYNFSSSWSLNGKGVPFVKYPDFDWGSVQGIEFLGMYNKALDKAKNIEEASIKVENINGPILLLSGEEDTVWPGTRMSNDMISRLDEKGFDFKYQHIAYKNAGHSLSDSYLMGGTLMGNKEAEVDSTARIIEFIDSM